MSKLNYLIFLFLLVMGACTGNVEHKDSINEENKLDSFETSEQLSPSIVQKLVRRDSSLNEIDEYYKLEKVKYLLNISDSISIWTLPIEEPMLKKYVLLVLDSTKIWSSILVKGVWIDNEEKQFDPRLRMLSIPLIYLKDLNNDSIKELIIKDRQNIGNTYNAAVEHYFTLLNNKIKYIGDFEYISHLPVEDLFLIRHWNNNTGLVQVYLKNNIQTKTDSTLVGDFKMNINSDSLVKTTAEVYLKDYKPMIYSTR